MEIVQVMNRKKMLGKDRRLLRRWVKGRCPFGQRPYTLGSSAGQSPAPQVFGEQDAFIGTSAQT